MKLNEFLSSAEAELIRTEVDRLSPTVQFFLGESDYFPIHLIIDYDSVSKPIAGQLKKLGAAFCSPQFDASLSVIEIHNGKVSLSYAGTPDAFIPTDYPYSESDTVDLSAMSRALSLSVTLSKYYTDEVFEKREARYYHPIFVIVTGSTKLQYCIDSKIRAKLKELIQNEKCLVTHILPEKSDSPLLDVGELTVAPTVPNDVLWLFRHALRIEVPIHNREVLPPDRETERTAYNRFLTELTFSEFLSAHYDLENF